ncbi:MAG: transglycosylase SLT domain-containing protein [Pseudomonadota bacterium]|nr:transglycosylase SLT domain-containing protein [Pseudomonadota bacterium]
MKFRHSQILKIVFLFPWLLLIGLQPVDAAIYSRKDASGNVHITDSATVGDGYNILLTTGKRPQGFQEMVVTGSEFGSLIRRAAKQTGLNPALIRAVIKVESSFNPRAVSLKGAKGLMQLMPVLACHYGVKDAFDPAANIMAGSSYLKDLQDRFGTLEKTLAAYNAGPSRVEKYNGPPPFAETQKYISQVKWYYKHYCKRSDLVKLKGEQEAFTQACSAFKKGDLRRSAYLFGLVLKKYPDSSEASYNLALVENRRGKMTIAVNLYRQALRYNPYFTEACYNLAILYERLSRLNTALATWKRCLQCELSSVKQTQIRLFMQELLQLQEQE